ncbi:MAG: LysR family transcriptional regulator [Erysipelotrichaceae bacterium]|nr:LysR family transcriptional regulator [Erysipelotrichaceae bacterium]
MEKEQIEAFLAVVNHGTISSAANNTYTTQGSISKRISALEKEIGVPLFIRNKGLRKVELTSYGKCFLDIARKWEALNREFEAVKFTNVIQEISIGATDLVNRITLKDLYRNIITNHPSYRLDLHSHHSPQIYKMMESHDLDLGFVNLLLPVSNIIVRKLFDEELVVLMKTNANLPKYVSCRDLDPTKEIFSRWNDEFEIWHEQSWPHRQYRIRVGTGSMISDYLDEEGFWTIAPITCIPGMIRNKDLKFARLNIETPKRSLYILEQKRPRQSRVESIDFIKNKIDAYLQQQLNI